MFAQLRVERTTRLRLARIDAGATPGFKGDKSRARALTAKRLEQLEELQGMLWAEHQRRVLVVLQGMDTSGKDSTISHVFEGVNPLGVKVFAWKAPTAEELAHDFLWRIHPKVPGAGELTIFNRSHYEDVVAARVRQLVPAAVWRRRFAEIRNFERLLTDNGTIVLKFFLHIDPDEQKRRLRKRLDDPKRRWKFQLSDLADRKLWPEFMAAYEDALRETSAPYAPWYVVPANHKWYRDLVVATVLVSALAALKLRHPEPADDLAGLEIE
jgi:PPK2 family polyphosphate:nucleotide phosphotransferase